MILAPTNRRIIRPGDKPSFEHTQKYGLVKGHWANTNREGLWLFNEGSGNKVFDLSSHGNIGTLVADTHFVPGKFGPGPALDFDGTGDCVDIADDGLDFGASDNFSIVVWFKTSSTSSMPIVSKGDGWYSLDHQYYSLRTVSPQQIGLKVSDGTNTVTWYGASNIADNAWHHVVVSWDRAGDALIYLDGIAESLTKVQNAGASNPGDMSNSNSLEIGKMSTDYFTGQVDHVSIYKRAPSASEVVSLNWNPFLGIQKKAAPVYFFVPSGIDVTVTPATLATAATLHAPTITTTRSVTVTPATLAITATLHAPTIVVPSPGVTVYPQSLEVAATLHAPHLVTPYTEIPPFMEKDLIDPFASGAWLWLVEIVVPTQDAVYIARNTEDVHYNGHDFDKFNLQIGKQIFSSDGSIPRVTLRTFQDISRKIENIINETEGALGGAVKLIRVNEKFLTSPVEALEADYDLLASESDSEWCTFTLGIPNPLTQRFPLRDYSSSMCPWTPPPLFKGPRCQLPPEHEDTSCTGTYEDCYTKGNAVHWGGELGLSPSVVKVRER